MTLVKNILEDISSISELEIKSWEEVEINLKNKIENSILSSNKPHCLCLPQNRQQLSQIVEYAHKNELSLFILGKGSKINWGNLRNNCDLVVSTEKLNQIVEHSVGDFTITVEAGINLSTLQNHLKQFNQYLPIDPPFPERATIGGIIATSDGGSLRHKYNGIRDLILGISFVRSDSEIVKAGGKVVKNVAGYDLMKLLTGSYGSLGIITEVTLRLYPILQNSQTIIITGEAEKINQAIKLLKNSSLTPIKADVLSSTIIKDLKLGENMGLLVQFQGILESINLQVSQLESIAKNLDLKTELLPKNKVSELYHNIDKYLTTNESNNSVTCKIGILPTFAVNFLEKLEELSVIKQRGIIHIDSGIGKIYLEQERLLASLKIMREYSQKYQGYLIILDAPKQIKKEFDTWGYNGNAITIMKKIKQKFDPKNILNQNILF